MPRTQPARVLRHINRPVRQQYRIVVGSSGDESSLGAIRVALALARRKSASVHVLTVATPFPHAAPTGFQAAPPSVIDDEGRRSAVDVVRRQLAVVRGTREWAIRATVGWPADAIIEAAERWPATLIVVGIGEHGALDRLIGSETAVAIAKRSKIPVLAVPAAARQLPTRAVAAVDFTDASIAAARLAASLLGPNGVLTLVHASTLIKADADAGSLLDVYTEGARDKLAEIRDRVRRDTKRRVEAVVLHGEIVESLLAYVDEINCDLLALGGHEQGLVDRLLLGSVRTRVLRHARCPVLVAPHAGA